MDSGSYCNIFPNAVADAINAQFDTQAGSMGGEALGQGLYSVLYEATPPLFNITIGNQTFTQPQDLILDAGVGTCISGIATVGTGAAIEMFFLRHPFFKNVVGVFDFGKDEMRFAQRAQGKSSATEPDEAAATSLAGTSASGGVKTNSGMIGVILASLLTALVISI